MLVRKTEMTMGPIADWLPPSTSQGFFGPILTWIPKGALNVI